MKTFLLLLTLFAILTTGSISADNNYVPGELLVMLKHNQSTSALTNDFGFIGLSVKEPVVEYMNIWLFSYNYSARNADLVLSEVRKHRSVAIAQFNHYVTERSIFPNDTRFGEQWSLHNTGQTGGTPDADIDAPEAWELTTSGLTAMGDTIVVAVVDGGFYLNHLDLVFWKNWYDIPGNNIDDDGNGYIDDYNGWNAYNQTGNITASGTHGTHVSGTAGALGNNSLGVSGVNWNIKIMPVQGSSGTEAIVVRAYGYVLKQRRVYDETNGGRGAFVVSTNSSFGVDYGQPINYPLWCAFYDSLGTAGILNACATANLNINIDVTGDIPTACPSEWMVSVTNTTNTDAKNSGAAYGLLTIDLGAPGTSILSTTSASNYGLSTGTSMATPHVAGAIAFMYNVAPSWWIQAYKSSPGPYSLIVKQKILQGVDPKPSLQNITVSGGRLNLHNSALLMQNLTAIGNQNTGIPALFRLYQNYPNPFNPSTIISFDVPKEGFVSLKIYNAIGQEVATLVNETIKAGSYNKTFNANNLPSGVYFYKLVTENFSDVRKMTFIK
ncbi:MAG: S8 family peptidase [Chlorobi bacterium]|nr:S8 family peptidase [Chlorobiota bacterium]MCI0715219.1 S8 family peptidase [Chlorobiota bacterium]